MKIRHHYAGQMVVTIFLILSAVFISGTNECFASACKPLDLVLEAGDSVAWNGGCKDNLPAGEGTLRVMRGGKMVLEYSGGYTEGYKSGKGSISWGDGSRYFGGFHQGAMHGTGTISLSNGDRYTGEFVAGKMQGQGVYTFANEDRYIGPFFEGTMHGIGIFRPSGGERHIVEYEDGKQKKMWADATGAFRSDHPVLAGVDAGLASRVVRLSMMIRELFGLEPVYTSGFRSAEKNAEVSGEVQSLHLDGRAVDLVVPGLAADKEEMVAELARRAGLRPLWHGEGSNHHLHLSRAE